MRVGHDCGRPCLGCGDQLPPAFLDLGRTPLANAYVAEAPDCTDEETFPLAVAYCDSCHLVQLADTVSPEKMFSEYAYFSSYSESFLEHARQMAESYIDRFKLVPGSRVLEIASNDGYLLRHFRQHGIEVLGIDPARNIAAEANRRGIPTLCRFFGEGVVPEIVSNYGKADLIVGNNVLAHVPGINDFLSAVAAGLRPDGAAVFECPYLGELLNKVEFDTIYHEHVFYYSLNAMKILAERAGLELFDVVLQRVHGGSLRIFLQLPGARPIAQSVETMRSEEVRIGLTSRARYASFAAQVCKLKGQLCSMLTEIKEGGNRIAAYGAPAKGNTLLNYCGIGRELIDFTVDRSPHKQGRLLPGSHLPILPPEELLARMPEYTVILPWNLADEIVEQQKAYMRAGGRFIVPVPSPRVIKASTAGAAPELRSP
jgi:SAM-dependent methyltransferase